MIFGMTPDMLVTLVVIVGAAALFFTEKLPVDTVALGIIVVLVCGGVLRPDQAVRGFANPAVITVACMFVISDALIQTGAIQSLAPLMANLLSKGYKRTVAGMGGAAGLISAFINNTPVVATFIPILSTSARHRGEPPSRYLMPLSYGAIFGGTCTLIGTSTNLLVSGIAEDNGLRGFSMFLMAPMGLIFAAAGMGYLLFFGRRLIPERENVAEFSEDERIRDFETEVEVLEEFDDDGRSLGGILEDVGEGSRVEVLQVRRGENIEGKPDEDTRLHTGDILHIRGDMEKIKSLITNDIVQFRKNVEREHFPAGSTYVVEIVLLPNSDLLDKRLEQARFEEKYRASPLAVRSRGEEKFTDLDEMVLRPGDILLLQTDEEGQRLLREVESTERAPFLSMRRENVEHIDRSKLALVLGTLVAIVLLSSFGVLPIMIAALGGVVALNLTGVTPMVRVYRAIDWQVIFLIAGALSLGKALEASGIDQVLGDMLIHRLGASIHPMAIVASLYLLTVICTEIMSNNAAAALVAPIAISVARSLNIDPIPLLLAVTFAGSASFMTPVGYQTNTMVYSAGNYRFRDFTKAGAPLSLLFWILATICIPWIYM